MNEEHTLSLEELGEIKTVKVYNQAYVDKQQERIETLERENEELKDYNEELLQSDIDKYNKIVLLSQKVNVLQKENAELKGQVEMSYEVYNNNLDYSYHIEEQLTEAKELLKRWVDDKVYTVSEQKDLIADTEQFLKKVSE